MLTQKIDWTEECSPRAYHWVASIGLISCSSSL